MSDVVIRAEHIGKAYFIGHQSNERYVALRDVIANKTKGICAKLRGRPHHTHKTTEEFWALKDINFEIKQGDRVGIIGRNGAGKSTLLKILSRITEPTSGRISIKGRVASLLEVGTGFHPELTGRENIFLNGAILGMTRQEIKRKFDEIVSFAEVEKFLDTPVKRYSSGMYVRLAFAVAAHLEPEILVVDEVLAVGDFEFQKKCLGKMSEVAQKGRTVLFVSHNMAAVRHLCSRCILIERGRLHSQGTTDEIISNYLNQNSIQGNMGVVDLNNIARSSGTQKGSIKKAWIEDGEGNVVIRFPMGEKIKFCFFFETKNILLDPDFGIAVTDAYGNQIFCGGLITARKGQATFGSVQKGIAVFEYDVFPLAPGIYKASFGLDDHRDTVDLVENVMQFEVAENDYFGNGRIYLGRYGKVFVHNKIYLKKPGECIWT